MARLSDKKNVRVFVTLLISLFMLSVASKSTAQNSLPASPEIRCEVVIRRIKEMNAFDMFVIATNSSRHNIYVFNNPHSGLLPISWRIDINDEQGRRVASYERPDNVPNVGSRRGPNKSDWSKLPPHCVIGFTRHLDKVGLNVLDKKAMRR